VGGKEAVCPLSSHCATVAVSQGCWHIIKDIVGKRESELLSGILFPNGTGPRTIDLRFSLSSNCVEKQEHCQQKTDLVTVSITSTIILHQN